MGSLEVPDTVKCEHTKTTSLVCALYCLHNFSIDVEPLLTSTKDRWSRIKRGGLALNENNSEDVEDFLHGSEHFDDCNRTTRNSRTKVLFFAINLNTRELIF